MGLTQDVYGFHALCAIFRRRSKRKNLKKSSARAQRLESMGALMASLGFVLNCNEVDMFDLRVEAINTMRAARGESPATDDEIIEIDEAEYLAAFAIVENDTMTDSDYPQTDTRPTIMDELTALRQWVCWKYFQEPGKEKPTKPPINPHTGLGASHSNPKHWSSHDHACSVFESSDGELAGVGFVLTKDDPYVGIDLDHVLDKATGEPIEDWVRELIEQPETYCEISPSGEGIRMIARGKIDKAYKLDAAQVEIYADRRYLTITGWYLPQSPIYINEAQTTIDALIARVESFKRRAADEKASQAGHGAAQSAPKANARGRSGDNFFRSVNDAALRNIPAWLPSIFPRAKRSANGAWRVASKDRGRRDLQEDISVSPDGIKDFGLHDMGDARDGSRTAIDIVVEFHGVPNAQDAALWLCERLNIDPISIGWRGGSHAEADDVANKAEVEDIKAKLAEREKREADTGNDRFADDLLRPDGVLGDMVDYILSISRRPIRIFAVASSVSALGNIIGRRVAGPTGSGTHSYNALLADTAGGKAAGLDAVTQIMLEVDHASMGKALRLVGPSRLSSGPGLWRHIKTSPLSLSVFDEIGNILSGVSNPKAPHYLKEISGILREVWGKSFKYVGSKANADGSGVDEDIKWPAYSLLGASTAEEFFGALTSKDATNGLLNRFIVFFSDDKPVYVHRPLGDEHHAPKHIIDALLDLHLNCMGNRDKPNLRDQIKDASFLNDDDKIVIEWDNDDVDKAFEIFSTEMFERTNKKNKEAPLYGRVAENAIRLATIHAVSRAGLRAKVTMRDLEWGQAIVSSSANRLVKEARFRISDNEHQAEANHIKNIIRKAGSAGIMAAELRRAIGGSIRGRSYKDIMESLIEGREIIAETERRTDEKGGRPKTTYYINADYDFDE